MLEIEILERLDPGWGAERNTVATLLVESGLDVLNDFPDEKGLPKPGDEEEEEGEGDEEGGGPAPPRDHRRPPVTPIGPQASNMYG